MRTAARVLLRIALAIVTAIAVAGWGGSRSETLDLLNSFAPVLLVAAPLLAIAALSVERERRGRLAIAIMAVVAIGAAAGRILPEYARPIARAGVGDPQRDLVVLTANVWKRNVDPKATLDAIRASGADVVLLQETDGRMDRRIDRLADIYPWRSFCWTRCSLTILSKRPFLREKFRLRDAANRKYGPDLAWARLIAPDGRPVTVATVHYWWPLPGRGQDRLRGQTAAALRTIDTRDLVLAGDMNLTPWSVAMRAQDRDFAPLTRVTRGLASWPARLGRGTPVPLPVLPIDQIYAGPAWRLVSIRRLSRSGSDHYPVRARLRRTGAE